MAWSNCAHRIWGSGIWTRHSRNGWSLLLDGLSWMPQGSGLKSLEGLFSYLLGGWCLFTSGNETSARLAWDFTHSLRAGFPGWASWERERDPCGNHIALHDSVVEVIRPNVCCGASYKDQPGFQVHLIQLAISWKLCGTGNMTFVIFGKHHLSQWTKEVDSTPKLIYKHTLILSWTWPSFYRPYIPVYLDCIGIRSTDYLEKSRYFPLSWKILAIWAEILICQYLPEDYHLFLFIFFGCSGSYFVARGIFSLLCSTWDL